MDKYAIMCIFILVVLCLWHTAMSALIFSYVSDARVTPDMWLSVLDRHVCFSALIVFVVIHCVLFTWLYFVPLRHRRRMTANDNNYRQTWPRLILKCYPIVDDNRTPLVM
jgi:hypothetical protein